MSSKAKQVVDITKPVVKRDINKWLYYIRQFLMRREFTHNQRHEFETSRRTQQPPRLPTGFAHKLFKNYYFERDARRLVGQPQVMFSNTTDNQFLASGTAQPQLTAGATAQPTNTAAAPAPTNTSSWVTITEAEKQTAHLLAAINNKEQKFHGQPRTPGKVYNWDG